MINAKEIQQAWTEIIKFFGGKNIYRANNKPQIQKDSDVLFM